MGRRHARRRPGDGPGRGHGPAPDRCVSSLAVNQAAFPNFTATFRDQGVSPELFEPFQALLDRAVDEGHAADGLSRLADLLGPRR
ncbi:imine reductase family protein [Streptomyces sp. PmtA]|uniref:imine reductase family protein n=1 Tax=Streptomyces sp. PmtA TaxID=3074275 RepID=UPI0030146FC7